MRPFKVRLIAFWHPSSLAPGPPPTTPSPPDALFGERFSCVRSRSPAAKARRDTSLKPEPKRFRCVNCKDHYLSYSLSDVANPCVHHIAYQPLHPLSLLFGCHSLQSCPTTFVHFTFFWSGLHPRLAALGTFVLVHSFEIPLF